MSYLFNFLLKISELKDIERKGITFYGVKKPDSAADHSFRMALMVWIFGKEKRLNIERAIKMALIHDVAKVHTGDITPYDGLLPKEAKEKSEFVRKWRRLSLEEKGKRHREKLGKENNALEKLLSNLPPSLTNDLRAVWLDYHQRESREAKFVHQIDVLENLLEALEMWKKDSSFPTDPWWEHADEVIEDSDLLEFLKEIEKEERKH